MSTCCRYETTAACLMFTSYLLASNPHVQEKLQAEIDQFFPSPDITASYDTVTELQYLQQVVSESLRIYPITAHVGRWAARETTIEGKTIPRNCAVSAAVWVLHHDKAFWPEPWTFDPERFAPENRDKIVEMTYMPFGAGPRNCIGRRFAMMEIKMALVEMFRRFNIQTCHKTPETLRVKNKGITISVVGDELWLEISRRQKCS